MGSPLPTNWVYLWCFPIHALGQSTPTPQHPSDGQILLQDLGPAGPFTASLPAAHPLDGWSLLGTGFFFLSNHISPSFTDQSGALGTLQPHCTSGNLTNHGKVASELPFLGRYLHFYRCLGDKNALNQKKGFKHGNFRFWEKLKQLMLGVAIASCTHHITPWTGTL